MGAVLMATARSSRLFDKRARSESGVTLPVAGLPNKPIIAGKTKGTDVITLERSSLAALAAERREFAGKHRI
jgi:hypothetical protein